MTLGPNASQQHNLKEGCLSHQFCEVTQTLRASNRKISALSVRWSWRMREEFLAATVDQCWLVTEWLTWPHESSCSYSNFLCMEFEILSCTFCQRVGINFPLARLTWPFPNAMAKSTVLTVCVRWSYQYSFKWICTALQKNTVCYLHL